MDTSRRNVGAEVGSGGLYNNTENPSKPTSVADNKLGDWNTFYIKMVGDRVTVVLNGQKVVDNVMLENFWDRSQPIFPIEQIELQAHGRKSTSATCISTNFRRSNRRSCRPRSGKRASGCCTTVRTCTAGSETRATTCPRTERSRSIRATAAAETSIRRRSSATSCCGSSSS